MRVDSDTDDETSNEVGGMIDEDEDDDAGDGWVVVELLLVNEEEQFRCCWNIPRIEEEVDVDVLKHDDVVDGGRMIRLRRNMMNIV